MKKNNNKGFTLAELLIVVAIIAVLTAIAIPVFTQQLERSREATDMANARSAYAQLITDYLGNGKAATVSVECKQTQDGWNYESGIISTKITTDASTGGGAEELKLPDGVGKGKKITLAIDEKGAITPGVA